MLIWSTTITTDTEMSSECSVKDMNERSSSNIRYLLFNNKILAQKHCFWNAFSWSVLVGRACNGFKCCYLFQRTFRSNVPVMFAEWYKGMLANVLRTCYCYAAEYIQTHIHNIVCMFHYMFFISFSITLKLWFDNLMSQRKSNISKFQIVIHRK